MRSRRRMVEFRYTSCTGEDVITTLTSAQATNVVRGGSQYGRSRPHVGLAILTLDSEQPLLAGSAGTRVRVVTPLCMQKATMFGLRTAMPATCSVVTVFSLSATRQVGAPRMRRSVTSRAAITNGAVFSRIASTTWNRD